MAKGYESNYNHAITDTVQTSTLGLDFYALLSSKIFRINTI